MTLERIKRAPEFSRDSVSLAELISLSLAAISMMTRTFKLYSFHLHDFH